MTSEAELSPRTRGVADINRRISIIEKYEKAFKKNVINLEEIVGTELWNHYWRKYEEVIKTMREAQETMNQIKNQIDAVMDEIIDKGSVKLMQ